MNQHRFRMLTLAVTTMVVSIGLPTIVRTVTAAGPSLNGGGSSFAKLEIDQWSVEVARDPYKLDINYVAQGSSFGRQGYSNGSLEFAASDIPFVPNELAGVKSGARGDFVYVPVSAGGLGFMYNLVDSSGQQVTTLNLTPHTACRIFTDDTIMWNDPELAAINPTIALPAERVRAVVRADGSGTSYVLSQYCMATAPDVWATFIQTESSNASADLELLAGRPTSLWPTARFGSATAADGVAAAVADSGGLYGITYNEAGFAGVRGFPNASVQNKYGNFTQPTERAVSIALGYATGNTDPATGQLDGTFALNFDGPDPEAYFPSTYSYVIAQTTGFDPAKGEVLARFLCYAITRGQRVDLTEALGYARLSAPLVDLGKTAIAKIPGAPPWEQCRVESAAPPPAPIPVGAGTGSTGSGSTGSGSTGSGSTGSGSTGDGSTGGGTQGDAGTAGSGAAGAGSGSTGSGSGSTGSGTGLGTGTTSTLPGAAGSNTGTAAGTGDVSTCVDPDTGLPADCVSLGSEAPVAAGGEATNSAGAASAIAAKNPPIDTDTGRPTNTQILWWLLQGGSICAVGVALTGVRRRFT